MSQEHVDLLRQGFDAWRRGDTKTVEALLRDFVAPGFEMHPLYLDKVYKGADGVLVMFADAREFWAEYSVELEDIIDLGETVLTLGRVRGRGRGSGVPIDERFATLWSFDGLKAVNAVSYPSKAEALEAVGLRE